MRRYGYARVSTDDQSLDIQREKLTKAGCEVIRAEKVSGKSLDGREQLRVLLDFIGQDDVLVVTKLDRLGRNLLDILMVIEELEGKGAQLVSLSEKFDTTQPFGKAMFQVAGVFSELERGMIKARQREGIEAAKQRGVYKGRKPTVPRDKVIEMLDQKIGPSKIARTLEIGESSVFRIKREHENGAADGAGAQQ